MHAGPRRRQRALVAIGAALVLAAGGALGATASAAVPATVPPVLERSGAMVTADALPTVQIDGVAWTQVLIGNTVYAAGDFTSARPAGAAPGTSITRRKNLLAYSLATGKLNTTFKPAALNGQVKALAVSSDRKTLYAGGDFTLVGTKERLRFAAFDARTGGLRKAAPKFNARVNALAVVGAKVYVGGWFTRVGTAVRTRAAAVTGSTGKLAAWAPSPDGSVDALVATPDRKRIVLGGRFAKIGSTAALGMGAVDAVTGRVRPWKINKIIKNSTNKAGITSLTADADTVYGTTFAYGAGNFEGAFAANPADGSVRWLQDCHGDTYSATPIGGLIYVVGHAHNCANVGGFPEHRPREWHHALVITKGVRGTVAHNTQPGVNYGDFAGQPAPAMLTWFPELTTGIITKQFQAAWSVVGTKTYVAAGGEFPAVNGKPQQGLVRFAVPGVARPRQGPRFTDASTAPRLALDSTGAVTISATTNTDRDQRTLRYTVLRREVLADGRTGAEAAVTRPRSIASDFWQRRTAKWTDASAADGSTYAYRVRVVDRDGNAATTPATTITTPPADSEPPGGR